MTIDVGEPIPAHTAHAVSVSLPTWAANVAYEEAEEWLTSRMQTGYPRFFVNKLIEAFADDIVKKLGRSGEKAMLFPSERSARRCVDFILARDRASNESHVRVIDLVLDSKDTSELLRTLLPSISAVLLPEVNFSLAREFWQHTGEGVSSRRAEFCHDLYIDGLLVENRSLQDITGDQTWRTKGPRRYQRGASIDKTTAKQEAPPKGNTEAQESSVFVEERFGRNLDVSLVTEAKSAIRRRIAGSLTVDDLATAANQYTLEGGRGVAELAEDDVLLYSCGMNAIFSIHRMLLAARGSLKSISFGFPYVDTLKVLQKFGPGAEFYGHGSAADLDVLEQRLRAGDRFLALFCEFPGNPMLRTPDLKRIRALADEFDFAVVIDETIGNFINVNILPYADVAVSSLTKIFSGECNVMGGSAVLNPRGRYYATLKELMATEYEDNYWAEDAIFMERNSRDFVSRIERINVNAEAICDTLLGNATVREVHYPKHVPTRNCYDACRTPAGGYGGLLSVSFHHKAQAMAFHDALDTAKGPSLGTNFTLSSPFVVIAHYHELDWVTQFGVDPNLIRISVGLEDTETLQQWFSVALAAADAVAC